MSNSQQNKSGFNWASITDALLNLARKEAVKALLKRFAISGGIKGWLVNFVVNELIEATDEHIIEPLMVRFGYKKSVKDGREVYERVINAEDRDDWRDAAGDV